MTKKTPSPRSSSRSSLGGKAALGAAAIGSAAIAAALLYANKRKEKKTQAPTVPSGEPPETD